MQKEKKQKSNYERVVDIALRRLNKVKVTLEEVRIHYMRGDMENVNDAAFAAVDYAEKLTNLTRVLPAYSGHPRAHEIIEEIILKAFHVEIGFTAEGWFCLRMPLLLPKKDRGSPAYISDPLYPAMKRFWRGKPPVRYPYNVTIFRHVYDRERPERENRDHDNCETKAVLDIVALYVMYDDSPTRCKLYYCSAPGDVERTEVYVVPQDEFIDWLELENSIPNKGVKLYENKPEKL